MDHLPMKILGPAVDLAEDVVSDHYRFSESFWIDKGRWELKTLAELRAREVTDLALAQIVKYSGPAGKGHRDREFYRICLQDHRLMSVSKGGGLDLHALLCYVVSHELIHVVRFAKHDQLFEAPQEARDKEERLVHDLTRGLLEPLELSGAKQVFRFADPDLSGPTMELTRRAERARSGGWIKEVEGNADLRV
jgi:hypothetical protein